MNYEYNTHVIKKMNMPFTITFVKREFFDSEKEVYKEIVTEIENYLDAIERKFSIFKTDSIVSRHNKLLNNFNEEFLDEEYVNKQKLEQMGILMHSLVGNIILLVL